jgi:predicted transcriptional regulator
MANVTPEQVLQTARDLDRGEFTRGELADELGVRKQDLKDGVKAARRAGRLEKVGDNEEGEGLFRLTAP